MVLENGKPLAEAKGEVVAITAWTNSRLAVMVHLIFM